MNRGGGKRNVTPVKSIYGEMHSNAVPLEQKKLFIAATARNLTFHCLLLFLTGSLNKKKIVFIPCKINHNFSCN